MTKKQFERAVQYMYAHQEPAYPDGLHPKRVLHLALCLAKAEGAGKVNTEVLVLACLLHDVGRAKAKKGKNHAKLGAQMAEQFLTEEGYEEKIIHNVKKCIETHSHKGQGRPVGIEAKILYDADKLDFTGASGCARMLALSYMRGLPFYIEDERGGPLPGRKDEPASLFGEARKREKRKETYYTDTAKKWGEKRDRVRQKFFTHLKKEMRTPARRALFYLKDLYGPQGKPQNGKTILAGGIKKKRKYLKISKKQPQKSVEKIV